MYICAHSVKPRFYRIARCELTKDFFKIILSERIFVHIL